MIKYDTDPKRIRKDSFRKIREKVDVEHLNEAEQQIALQLIYESGNTEILDQIRFSKKSTDVAMNMLDDDYELLTDTEIVISSLNVKYMQHEPICMINKASVISQAKAEQKTRSMIAVDLWSNYLSDSIVIIGSEATALFRLLEILEENTDHENKPALIIAMPVGFTGAVESKQYLWENHEKLEVPCITLLGTQGGSTLAATVMNTFLDMKQEKYF